VQSQLGPHVVLGVEPVQLAVQALGPQMSVASWHVVMVPLHVISQEPAAHWTAVFLHESLAVHSTVHSNIGGHMTIAS
jgi:hypothetical protein